MSCNCESCQALAALDARLNEIKITGEEPSEADKAMALFALKEISSSLEEKIDEIGIRLNEKWRLCAVLSISKT